MIEMLRMALPVLAFLATAAADPGRAPARPAAAVGLAEYWQKSFVGPDGSLLYGAPGAIDGYRLKIAAGLTRASETIRQDLAESGLPVVRTLKRAGDVEIEEEILPASPFEKGEAAPLPESPAAQSAIERLGSKQVMTDWAAPAKEFDPAFRDIAVGSGEPVRYRFRAEAGKSYTVIFGLCEGWHARPGQRVLDLAIEGKPRRKVDMVAEKGKNVPALYPFEARDEDGDGWIDVSVAAAAGSPDVNSILNVLWVFAGDGAPPALDDLLAGRSPKPPMARLGCGSVAVADEGHPRHDLLFLRLRNAGSSEAKVTPALSIRSEAPALPDPGRLRAWLGAGTRIDCASRFEGAEARGGETVLRFAEVAIPAGGAQVLAFAVARGRAAGVLFASIAEAENVRTRALEHWAGAAAKARSATTGESSLRHRAGLRPLPPGAVEPAGWLRDWALAAKDGITGHLDEWHPTFADGWKGIPIAAPGAAPDGGGWPIEQSSYWLDGLVRLGFMLHDDSLIRKASGRLALVVDGVNRGADSFIYWRKGGPAGFDSWAHSHMGRALVAWYEGTGDRRILDALVAAYRDYPVPRDAFGFDDITGFCNIDAMLETYSLSGDRRVLDRVLTAAGSPGIDSSFRAWADGRFDPGHAVCAWEKVRLPILLYPWTGEAMYRQASERAVRWFDEAHMQPHGLTSGEENLSGIGAFRLTETCDVAAQLWSSAWLYRITGERSWGDRMERAFFNAGAAPIARDFRTMCYYQSPNRIGGTTLPGEQPNAPGRGCLKFDRLGYPHVLCCVGAVNRILPSYIQHMWMATGDGGLAATLYGPCQVSALAGAKVPVKLTCRTAYPFEETIRVAVDPERPASFPLYFRIPEWCAGARLAVGGAPVAAAADANGFARIERTWTRGDTVELALPMSVRIARGFETEYPSSNRRYFGFKPDEVFVKRRLPFESVSLGPLLFALPIADKDPDTPVPEARWQFALDVDPERRGADVEVERRPMPAKWDWPCDAPIALQLPGKAFDWKPTDVQPLPPACVEGARSETIRLVPYGCTKFRISMFPVTARAWGKQ